MVYCIPRLYKFVKLITLITYVALLTTRIELHAAEPSNLCGSIKKSTAIEQYVVERLCQKSWRISRSSTLKL